MHKYPQNQCYVGSSGQTLTTNMSMTPCSWQICHQTHVLCGPTTFVPNRIRYQINTVPTPTVAWTRAWLLQGLLVGLGWRPHAGAAPRGVGVLPCPTTRLNNLTVRFQGRADYRQPPDPTEALVGGRYRRPVCRRARGQGVGWAVGCWVCGARCPGCPQLLQGGGGGRRYRQRLARQGKEQGQRAKDDLGPQDLVHLLLVGVGALARDGVIGPEAMIEREQLFLSRSRSDLKGLVLHVHRQF